MALVGRRMERKASRKKIHDFMVTSPKTRTEQSLLIPPTNAQMSETFLMTKQASKKGNT